MHTPNLSLSPLPEQLAALGADLPGDAMAAINAEYQAWRELHDRLIALIAAFLDEAVENGRDIADVLEGVARRCSIGVTDLLGTTVDPASVAALLRAHGSTGSTEVSHDRTIFRHECGTGLKLWRADPSRATLDGTDVPGVPAGVIRYCARCIHTIAAYGEAWQVSPPSDPSGHCTWTLARTPAAGT